MGLEKETIYILGAIISITSSLITAFATFIITLISKYFEEKRSYRELIVNAAIENWKRTCETLDKASYQDRIYSTLDEYLLYMNKFSELFLDKKLKINKMEKKLNELDKIKEILKNHYSKRKFENGR